MTLPSLKRLALQSAPAPTGVAKAYELVSDRPGRRVNKEIVWFADKDALNAATCNAGGHCGYEAIFNLFPWIAQQGQRYPFAAQLLRSAFVAEHVTSAQGNNDYGIDSNDALQFARKLYAEFLGAHANLTREDQVVAQWLAVAGDADVLVQPFFDPGMWAAAGHEVPSDDDAWQGLIASRLDAVQVAMSAAQGSELNELSVDFVINSGWHFTVLRMRDRHPNHPQYFEWDTIDPWSIQRQGPRRSKQDAFNRREAMTTEGAVRELVYVLTAPTEPQPILLAVRPKIWQPRGMGPWLHQWELCARVGKALKDMLEV